MNNTHIALQAIIAHEIAFDALRAGDFFSFEIASAISAEPMIDREDNLYRVIERDRDGTLFCVRMAADGLPAPRRCEFSRKNHSDDSSLSYYLRMIVKG